MYIAIVNMTECKFKYINISFLLKITNNNLYRYKTNIKLS